MTTPLYPPPDVLNRLYRLADYPLLTTLAAAVTTASCLDGRACRYLYAKAGESFTRQTISEVERDFMTRLGIVPK